MNIQHHRAFEHVLIIMLENQYRSYVMQNPYFKKLARQGISLRNSFGVMHPSQTNYITSIAGELCNVADDDPPEPLPQRTIVDLIEESPRGLTWKAYMQSYDPQKTPWSPTLKPKDQRPYVIRHNPFSSFKNIQESSARWERIQDEDAFWMDIQNGTLPNYAWFTPNIWNDGHYLTGKYHEPEERAPTLVDQTAEWLESFLGKLGFPGPDSLLPPRTLVVITFDEADFKKSYVGGSALMTYDGPNQIYTVLLGDMIQPGEQAEGYNHYSLLRTIEENFQLGSLGKNDASSNWFQFLWGRQFRWEDVPPTPVSEATNFVLAEFAGALHLVYATRQGELRVRTSESSVWSEERSLGVSGSGPMALAATTDQLVLVYETRDGTLNALSYAVGNGWSSAPTQVATGARGALSLVAFADGQRLMLAYRTEEGAIQSRIHQRGAWEGEVQVPGAFTEGPMTLGSLGASLYLIYRPTGGTHMSVVSYNTAPFNVVIPTSHSKLPGGDGITTRDMWSPSQFPVAAFTRQPLADSDGEPEPWNRPYTGGSPLATAEFAGVLHLVHPVGSQLPLMTETFSLSGLMTPAKSVAYATQDPASFNDGFGTLAQAGWSPQSPILGAHGAPGGGLGMARVGDALVLAFQPEAGGRIHLREGRYLSLPD
ncbi:alkaline phosphatase family protein [Myxococcus sp. MxC21-1]|uniref:alkaline phosphatase family protein n=1 Tax=Myxococcus sp. MxC21-1 TaxID=3041439 RepID=UPI002931C5A5|nr:alkaline phosphatase family protein [Myxococcus sp. MxC21-1]WNZ60974.1 alkaline phosphatase family protein [Myxococcus sp. MxC21-1]